jgi:hypothetical protein
LSAPFPASPKEGAWPPAFAANIAKLPGATGVSLNCDAYATLMIFVQFAHRGARQNGDNMIVFYGRQDA